MFIVMVLEVALYPNMDPSFLLNQPYPWNWILFLLAMVAPLVVFGAIFVVLALTGKYDMRSLAVILFVAAGISSFFLGWEFFAIVAVLFIMQAAISTMLTYPARGTR
jgi:hypothetical protein